MRIAGGLSAVFAVSLASLLLSGCVTGRPQKDTVGLFSAPEQSRSHALRPIGPGVPTRAESEAQYVTFLEELGKYESGGLTEINYGQPGNQLGYIGGWQFGEAALVDAGFYQRDRTPRVNDWRGRWTGRMGVRSKDDFLSNPDAQWVAIKTLMPQRWAALRNMGLDRFVGETIKGVEVTHSGMLAASHLAGPGGVRDLLRSGGRVDPSDANDTSASDYLARFLGFGTPYVQRAAVEAAVYPQLIH